jgi:hypothetical protein
MFQKYEQIKVFFIKKLHAKNLNFSSVTEQFFDIIENHQFSKILTLYLSVYCFLKP